MKPDAFRLTRETYPVSVIVPSRFRDLDTLGHLNNVALGSFYEEGRACLNRAAFPLEMRHESGLRMLIADVHIAYLAEAHYPGDIEVAAGVSHIGRSSYTIALALFQNGQCVGTCETVLVVTDDNGAVEIPPAQRAALEGLKLTSD
ncbi:acyl-CoA thioesterase [Hyphomonadaceae bacterium ML37]|nr:acyl-CoA thioesterase [Hyphomonadaceae bacterium ML37]